MAFYTHWNYVQPIIFLIRRVMIFLRLIFTINANQFRWLRYKTAPNGSPSSQSSGNLVLMRVIVFIAVLSSEFLTSWRLGVFMIIKIMLGFYTWYFSSFSLVFIFALFTPRLSTKFAYWIKMKAIQGLEYFTSTTLYFHDLSFKRSRPNRSFALVEGAPHIGGSC